MFPGFSSHLGDPVIRQPCKIVQPGTHHNALQRALEGHPAGWILVRSRRSASRCCRAANAATAAPAAAALQPKREPGSASTRPFRVPTPPHLLGGVPPRGFRLQAAHPPRGRNHGPGWRGQQQTGARSRTPESRPPPRRCPHRGGLPAAVRRSPRGWGWCTGRRTRRRDGRLSGPSAAPLLKCLPARADGSDERNAGKGSPRVLPQGRRQAPLAGASTPRTITRRNGHAVAHKHSPQSGDHSGVRHRRSAAVSRSGAREVGDARQPFTATGKRIAKGRWQQHSTVRDRRYSSSGNLPSHRGRRVRVQRCGAHRQHSAICVAVRSQVPRGGRPLPGWARRPDPFFVNIERSTFRARTGTTAETANHPRTQLEWAL